MPQRPIPTCRWGVLHHVGRPPHCLIAWLPGGEQLVAAVHSLSAAKCTQSAPHRCHTCCTPRTRHTRGACWAERARNATAKGGSMTKDDWGNACIPKESGRSDACLRMQGLCGVGLKAGSVHPAQNTTNESSPPKPFPPKPQTHHGTLSCFAVGCCCGGACCAALVSAHMLALLYGIGMPSEMCLEPWPDSNRLSKLIVTLQHQTEAPTRH